MVKERMHKIKSFTHKGIQQLILKKGCGEEFKNGFWGEISFDAVLKDKPVWYDTLAKLEKGGISWKFGSAKKYFDNE